MANKTMKELRSLAQAILSGTVDACNSCIGEGEGSEMIAFVQAESTIDAYEEIGIITEEEALEWKNQVKVWGVRTA
jgi:hypothetical protein